MLKLRLMMALCCLVTWSQTASAMSIRNTSLVFANHGMCSAAFDIDSGLEEMSDVKIYYQVLNEVADTIDNGMFLIDHFGYSTASRFERVYLEKEALCEEALTLKITKATAVINGKKVDLIKFADLREEKFKPMKIIINSHRN